MGAATSKLLGGKKAPSKKKGLSAIGRLTEPKDPFTFTPPAKGTKGKSVTTFLSPFNPRNPDYQRNMQGPKPGVFNALKRGDTYKSAAKYGAKLSKEAVVGPAKGAYEMFAKPSQSTKELERITGVSKLPTGLRQPLQAITRLVGAAPAGLADYVGREVIGERQLAKKVIKGELPGDVLTTKKPGLQEVGDILEHSINTVLTFYGGGKAKNAKLPAIPKTTKPLKTVIPKPLAKSVSPGKQIGEVVIGKKVSKIAASIEQKAIENRLTKGFDNVAGYDPITIKQQSALAAETIVDLKRTARIVRGEEAVPQGLNPVALITAVEEHIARTGDAKMAYDLANSNLVSETSVAAQSLRLAAERNPDGMTAQLRAIKQVKEQALIRRQGPKAAKMAKNELKTDLVKAAPKAKDWAGFLEELKCK